MRRADALHGRPPTYSNRLQLSYVRFWHESGHAILRCTCLLLTQSGHWSIWNLLERVIHPEN